MLTLRLIDLQPQKFLRSHHIKCSTKAFHREMVRELKCSRSAPILTIEFFHFSSCIQIGCLESDNPCASNLMEVQSREMHATFSSRLEIQYFLFTVLRGRLQAPPRPPLMVPSSQVETSLHPLQIIFVNRFHTSLSYS